MEHSPMSESAKVIAEIAAERRRQVEVEGWTPEHDDTHEPRKGRGVVGQLAEAAKCYISGSTGAFDLEWPWEIEAWKPDGYRRNLVKAAALLAAEIERYDRGLKSPTKAKEQGMVADGRVTASHGCRTDEDAHRKRMADQGSLLLSGNPQTWSLRLSMAVQAHLAGLKQRDLAAEMGVSEARISQIMRAPSNWTIGTVERLLMSAAALSEARDERHA
jgi:hypothetical protein